MSESTDEVVYNGISTDGSVEDAAETTPVTGTTGYIVWDTRSYVVCSGPYESSDVAQEWINHAELRASRAESYQGTVYAIGTVVL